MQAEADLLAALLLKENASSCSTTASQSVMRLKNFKVAVNKVVIAIADLVGAENESVKKAREENKKLDLIQSGESLIGESFKVSKDLAEVLDSSHQQGRAHFFDGIIGLGLENYQNILQNQSKTVCILQTTSSQKLADQALLKILSLSLQTVQAQDPADASGVVQTSNLTVRVSAKDQLYAFECRLSQKTQTSDKEAEFIKAFGSHLQQNSKSALKNSSAK